MRKTRAEGKLLSRLIWSHRWHVLFRLDCSSASASRSAEIPGGDAITVSTLDRASYAQQSALRSDLLTLNPANADYLLDVESGRAIAVLIHSDNRLVHHGFLFIHNRTHRILGLPRDTALIGHAFTVPEFRGRGLQALSIQARARAARLAGFDFVCAETDLDNIRSQRGMSKAGMEKLGEVEIVRLFWGFIIRPKRPPGFSLLGLVI